MTEVKDIRFSDNAVATAHPQKYKVIEVDLAKILKSWRESLFAFEWMASDGRIKDIGELSEKEQAKRAEIESLIETGGPLEKPVLGIGLLENVEIGAGRATLLTLAAHGIKSMPVHIAKSHEDEFKSFLA